MRSCLPACFSPFVHLCATFVSFVVRFCANPLCEVLHESAGPREALLPALLQLNQNLARDFLEGLENPYTLKCDRFDDGLIFPLQFALEGVHG